MTDARTPSDHHQDARPAVVSDSVVVATARKAFGSDFDECDKALVRSVLQGALDAGYAFMWVDTPDVDRTRSLLHGRREVVAR